MTTIGPNTHVNGRIEGDEDVVVYGHVSGSIALDANLLIADGGHVHGEVSAKQVVVEGYVDGSINASELLVLAATARVVAEIDTTSLRMDDGAQLAGNVTMDLEGEVPARATAVKAAKPAKTTPKPTPTLVEETQITEESEPVTSEAEEDEYWTYDDLTVKELRDLLREYDQPVTGTKSELIERLEELEGE